MVSESEESSVKISKEIKEINTVVTVGLVVCQRLKTYQRRMPMSKNMQERFLFFFYNKPFIVNICKFTLHVTIIWLKEQGF